MFEASTRQPLALALAALCSLYRVALQKMAGAALKGGQGHNKAELTRLVAQRRAVQRAYMRVAAQAFARIQSRMINIVCLCCVCV